MSALFLWLRRGEEPSRERLRAAQKPLSYLGKMRSLRIEGNWQGVVSLLGDAVLSVEEGRIIYEAQAATGIRTAKDPNRFLASHLDSREGLWVILEIDPETSAIRLACDRFGAMPIYLYEDQDNFILSSTVNTIRAAVPGKTPISKPRIAGCLSSLLAPYFGSQTLFEHIRRPKPGMLHRFDLGNGSVESSSYLKPFQPPPLWVPPSPETFDHWSQRLRELLHETVVRNFGSVQNLAFELSGGVDSSILAVEFKRSGIPFSATSVTYPECKGQEPDESVRAALTARRLGFDIHWVKIEGKDVLRFTDELTLAYAEPVSDPSLIAAYMQERVIRSLGHRSVVSGQDGDVLFGGLAALWMGALLLKDPARALALWRKWRYLVPPSGLFGAALIFLSPFTRALVERTKRKARSSVPWLKVTPQLPRWYASEGANYIIYRKQHEIEEVLSILFRWVHERSALLGLYHYLPYLSLDLTDLMDSVPPSLVLHEGYNKYLARLAYSDELPSQVIWHRGKLGFRVPLETWVQGPWRSELKETVFESGKLAEIVDILWIKKHFDELDIKLRWRLYAASRFLDLFA